MRKALFVILIFAPLLFASCQTEVTLTLQKDDSVDIRFEGGAGEAFSKMISAAAGLEKKDSETGASALLIDSDSVSYELAKAGFSNVKVNQKKNGTVSISMADAKQSSYLFTSKILKTEKNKDADKDKLKPAITRKSLEDFYAYSDEQTRMILDLFLAPVFNDEEMTEPEYIEMIGAFYGEAAAKEVSQSTIKINLISRDGTKETLRIPLAQLMCGSFNY